MMWYVDTQNEEYVDGMFREAFELDYFCQFEQEIDVLFRVVFLKGLESGEDDYLPAVCWVEVIKKIAFEFAFAVVVVDSFIFFF